MEGGAVSRGDATFITRLDTEGDGPGLAVKDLIDVAGVPTTAGCPGVADQAGPAEADAACLAGARAAGARVVGKTNLHELALGTTGVNPWYGTPVNPLDASLVPGGSSSGSAVAVANGEAVVALGTDTAGSIRIPSACCGTVGLKTTWDRLPLEGIRPVAPSLDVVGPMAASVEGVCLGMALLEPGFGPGEPPVRVGRVKVAADPLIDRACDEALGATGWQVAEVDLGDWPAAGWEAVALLAAESFASNGPLISSGARVSKDMAERITGGEAITAEELEGARRAQRRWQGRLAEAFEQVDLLCLPTMARFPRRVDEEEDLAVVGTTLPVNVAGVPALALPVPSGAALPASLQLVGPWGSEERLVAAGLVVEGSLRPA
jgi:amidase